MENVTLKIQVGHVSVEVTGEPDYAEKKVEELLEKYTGFKIGEQKVAHSAQSHAPQKIEKGLAPNEFIRKIAPKTQVDRGLALSYYLEQYSSLDSFTTAELADLCKKAKQPAFTNISDVVGQLVSRGLLMGSGDKDGKRAYSLTTSGEEQVEALLNKQG
jgi:hypothetical protein